MTLDTLLLDRVFQPLANAIQHPHVVGKYLAPGILALPLMHDALTLSTDTFDLVLTLIGPGGMSLYLWSRARDAEKSPNPNRFHLAVYRKFGVLCIFIILSIWFLKPSSVNLMPSAAAWLWLFSSYLLSCEIPPPRASRNLVPQI